MRAGVMEHTKALPTKTRVKRVAEEIPPPPVLERQSAEAPAEPVKTAKPARKNTSKPKSVE
jgi:hypothetical protein